MYILKQPRNADEDDLMDAAFSIMILFLNDNWKIY